MFIGVSTEGPLLPMDLLERVAARDPTLGGMTQADYRIGGGRTLGEAVAASFVRCVGRWDRGERALLPLLEELGYRPLPPCRGVEVEGRAYPISHEWRGTPLDAPVPIYLVPPCQELDTRVTGGRRSPHSLLQELLNRCRERTWGLLSNGRHLRVLRDNASLAARPWHLEFDLERMMTGRAFSDFTLFWLICHASRLEGRSSEDMWIERWWRAAQAEGARALDTLRTAVQDAITALGQGFLESPELRERLRSGALDDQGFYRQLLRLAYRLVFLCVVEDRGYEVNGVRRSLLMRPDASEEACARYRRFYSIRRLRRRVCPSGPPLGSAGARHGDLYAALRVVMKALGSDAGCLALGLPALGTFLWSDEAIPDLVRIDLSNRALLRAVRALCVIAGSSGSRAVDYRRLGAEELGSVYEGLLGLHPRVDTESGGFALSRSGGRDRKTTGTYYTPSGLIECLLDSALDPVLEEAAREPDAEEAILALNVCDPACGSGHFLLAAARRIARRLACERTGEEEPSPSSMRQALRDVVSQCIHGVDLNEMAVELCKVALWMESLEPGKPLSRLDARIVCGDSLLGTTPALLAAGISDRAFVVLGGDDRDYVRELKKRNREEVAAGGQPTDGPLAADGWCAAFLCRKMRDGPPAVTQGQLREPSPAVRAEIERLSREHRFLHWHLAFPHVFSGGDGAGFDVVLGNPPWEQIQYDPQEEFRTSHPEIAGAPNLSARLRTIDRLGGADPGLRARHRDRARAVEALQAFFHNSGLYPLTSIGRLNSAPLFAERSISLCSPRGLTGLVLPSGIATDAFNQRFFSRLMNGGRLVSLFDFENRRKIFPSVHGQFKFCLMTVAGEARRVARGTQFVSYARDAADVLDESRRFSLTAEDVALLNPNTRTFPLFRSRRDADLGRAIHARVPVLCEEGPPTKNPWGIRFQLMFMMNTDSHRFESAARGGVLPLYEAKMVHQFDHRWATFDGDRSRELRGGEKQSAAVPRYWVAREDVEARLAGRWPRPWLLAFRDITNTTNERTVIAAILPRVAAGNNLPLLLPDARAALVACLLGNLNSFVLDYAARLKVGGTHLNFFIARQLPVLPPEVYERRCPWSSGTLLEWLLPRVLELTFTSEDLLPFAVDCGWDGPPFGWDDARRFLLRCELDAAWFHLYGVGRDDVRHVMDSFPIVRRKDEDRHGEYRTRRVILDAYEALAPVGPGAHPMAGAIERSDSYPTRVPS